MAAWGDPEPAPEPEPESALEKLAAELDGRRFTVTLIKSAGRRARLRITNRAAAQLTEDIYAGDGWYWFGWSERIAPVGDVATAAEKVAHVLRALDARRERSGRTRRAV